VCSKTGAALAAVLANDMHLNVRSAMRFRRTMSHGIHSRGGLRFRSISLAP
jgi:hypothetical protein